MSQFERCHGNGEAYKKYKAIESKFTEEFNTLTFELMVETYIRDQMRNKVMSDRDYTNLNNIWRSIAEELGVLKSYPYPMNQFVPGHPRAQDVAREGKKRLGIG